MNASPMIARLLGYMLVNQRALGTCGLEGTEPGGHRARMTAQSRGWIKLANEPERDVFGRAINPRYIVTAEGIAAIEN